MVGSRILLRNTLRVPGSDCRSSISLFLGKVSCAKDLDCG